MLLKLDAPSGNSVHHQAVANKLYRPRLSKLKDGVSQRTDCKREADLAIGAQATVPGVVTRVVRCARKFHLGVSEREFGGVGKPAIAAWRYLPHAAETRHMLG